MTRAVRNTAQKHLGEMLEIESEECIVWPYGKQNHGYGVIYIDGKLQYIHRLALINRKGEAPIGKPHALHVPLICHNPACFNYRHLRWGSRTDNAQDRILDGDSRLGEKHPYHRLTERQVLEIFNDTRKHSIIATEYGIHPGHVSGIRRGKSWSWLTNNIRREVNA